MSSNCCPDIKIFVCALTVLFGMGSWIAINGIWVELPILVDQLPEGWNLPSYLAVIIQLANIGPISVTLWNVLLKKQPPEKLLIYVMVTIGSLASVLLAFFWKETSFIANAERSTALFVLMFFLSLVDCTSSVVFLPFMNFFKPQYLTSYYIGEGFSGLLPSLVALVQGVGKVDCLNNTFTISTTNETQYQIQAVYRSPQFPVKDFFLFVFAMMVVCGLAFTLLNYLPYCRTEHSQTAKSEPVTVAVTSASDEYEMNFEHAVSSTLHFVDPSERNSKNTRKYHLQLKYSSEVGDGMSKCDYLYYLLLIGWVNAMTNGVLPSIQTYACLPFGTNVYHLAVTLSNIANPLACCVAYVLPISSGLGIGAVTVLGSGFAVYIMTLAVLSPVPPLVDTMVGSAFVVASFVIVYFLLSFTKVAIATLFRGEGRKALLWCGAVTQLGSALGAAVMFVTVNVYNLFQQKYPCT